MTFDYVRVLAGSRGIHTAFEQSCPVGDPRREGKPSESWIPKVEPGFSKGVAYWKKAGIDRYIKSELFGWHITALSEDVRVLGCDHLSHVIYEDEWQAVTTGTVATTPVSLENFLRTYCSRQITPEVWGYILRGQPPELLVCQHPDRSLRLPGGEIIENEHPCEAMWRQLKENAGIDHCLIFRKIKTHIGYDKDKHRFLVRQFYHCTETEPLDDRWVQKVGSSGLTVQCFWLPLKEARTRLASHGIGLDNLLQL